MKKFTIITAAFLLLLLPNIKAQLTGIKVAPLQLGNIWVYDVGYMAMRKITVVDTNIVIDTLSYFKLRAQSNYGSEGNEYARLKEDGFYALRKDTAYPEPNHELLYYKKNAIIGDTWTVEGIYVHSVEDTFTANVFGEPTTVKYLKIDSGMELYHQYWTEKFGLLSEDDRTGLLSSLLGCVIDGTVYGDTSFTTVSVDDEFAITENFWLKQNYPNPFNPTTTISFSVAEYGFITLKVYDILGSEVAVLISEKKPAGKYEIKFNATGLASGMYIYKLTSGNYSSAKKLMLMR